MVNPTRRQQTARLKREHDDVALNMTLGRRGCEDVHSVQDTAERSNRYDFLRNSAIRTDWSTDRAVSSTRAYPHKGGAVGIINHSYLPVFKPRSLNVAISAFVILRPTRTTLLNI